MYLVGGYYSSKVALCNMYSNTPVRVVLEHLSSPFLTALGGGSALEPKLRLLELGIVIYEWPLDTLGCSEIT